MPAHVSAVALADAARLGALAYRDESDGGEQEEIMYRFEATPIDGADDRGFRDCLTSILAGAAAERARHPDPDPPDGPPATPPRGSADPAPDDAGEIEDDGFDPRDAPASTRPRTSSWLTIRCQLDLSPCGPTCRASARCASPLCVHWKQVAARPPP